MNESLIQKQVCTLEQAKKLKDLGFEQKSLFFYLEQWRINGVPKIVLNNEYNNNVFNPFSAYTETELKAFYPYGVTYQYFDLFTLADDLIKLVEENEIPVEDLNDGYLEYFDIE